VTRVAQSGPPRRPPGYRESLEPALDHDQRHAFESQLDGVRVPEVVRREVPANPKRDRRAAEVGPGGGARPLAATRRAGENAEQRPDGKLESRREPGVELGPAPRVDAELTSPLPLPRRTSSAPRRGSRSASTRASVSWLRSQDGPRIRRLRSAVTLLADIEMRTAALGTEQRRHTIRRHCRLCPRRNSAVWILRPGSQNPCVSRLSANCRCGEDGTPCGRRLPVPV
jgi:hypothetical protein